MRRLAEAGADVFRLNFSHGTADEHARLIERSREVEQQTGKHVAVLGDLPGPKLRVGEVDGGVRELERGDELVLTTGEPEGDAIGVSWGGMADAVAADETIYLADGTIRLRVDEVEGTRIRCEVVRGGDLASHKGINLPGSSAALPAVSERDLGWVAFAVEHEVDLLALSFVRRVADLQTVTDRLDELGSSIPVIPKFEKPEAVDNAEELVKATVGGIMIARGDLGIEIPIERVPGVQTRLIELAGRWSVPAITATQMLHSMVDSRLPTRAEATDVANAIRDGTDAVMLSEETTVGRHPVEAVETMARIAEATEADLPYREWARTRAGTQEAGAVAGTVAFGAISAAYGLDLAALVVPTESGRTARIVSAKRPEVPVLAVSPHESTVRRVSLLFGVSSYLADTHESLRDLLDHCALYARETGLAESGQLIGVTAGIPEQQLGTNLFEVHRVP